jgi:DNA-binding GntR family transcriptional regulator
MQLCGRIGQGAIARRTQRCIVCADPSARLRRQPSREYPMKTTRKPASSAKKTARSEHRDKRSPIRKGGRHEAMTAELRRMIISGEFPPGSRIREQPLTERFGVSRTPIREALRSLAIEGFVQLLPNRSAIVPEVNASDVAHIIDVIATIEARAAVLACENATRRDIEQIAKLQRATRQQFKRGDLSAYFATNQLIHGAIVKSSGNPMLLWTWNLLAARAQRAKSLSHRVETRWTSAMAEHEAMVVALTARDGKALANFLLKHHRTGVRLVQQMEKV